MRAFLILALCFAAVAAVPSNPQRIVGGSVTTIDSYPSIASLLYSWDNILYNQACGGTILNSRSILSAAHCTFGDPAFLWRVRIGSTFANSGGTVYSVSTILNHAGFNFETTDNDITVLRTTVGMVQSSLARPASIAGTNYNLADNQVVWAAGWGTISSGGPASEQLRHVQIWTINQALCSQRYALGGAIITDSMLCSGWLDVGGRDQCQGDSGGPLYHNGVLVGVCSWGYGCADAFYPGVNTRVSSYTAWIQANA